MQKEPSLFRIFQHPFKFNKKYSVDLIDQQILRKINGGVDGTIELSKFIKMAPKNLLNRIKKYQRMGLIETDKTPQKPKGWKRHFRLSKRGQEYIEFFDSFNLNFKKR